MRGAAALLTLALCGTSLAQTDPTDHSAHHPGQSAPTAEVPAQQPVSAAAPGNQAATGGGGMMDGMMGHMGGGPRPFQATLLDMPVLTPEARRFIEAEAERRIGWGSQAIAAGQARLRDALATNDPAALRQATAGLREGLLHVESGAAALRALESGTPPRQLALTWFKDQLGVPTAQAVPMVMDDGPWGLSWYHLTMMVFLAAFMIGALTIQYARMRRISGLVQRLTAGSPGATPGPASSEGPAVSLATAGPTVAPATVDNPDAAAPVIAVVRRPWSGMLRIAAIFPETSDVKTFRLMDPAGGDIPFTFVPGQFLTFSVEIEGERAKRSYTIASSPTQRSFVEVTVKREAHGLISRHLHDRVVVGDPMEVSAPSGVFTFTGTEADSIVLIAGGVGITPMMSITRYLIDRSYPGDIFFLYGAHTTQDFIFREELEYLQRRHANLHVTATMARAEGTAWMGAEGRISQEFIARSVPEIARRRVHVCGPPPMMEMVRTALTALGVPREQIKSEAFGPAQGVAPGTAAPLPAPAPAPGLAGGAPRIATTEIQFTRSGKTGALAPDQTVLEAAEAIGVQIDNACRVGICGTCMVPLKAGKVSMEVEEGLPPGEKARGMILACQAKSVGNLVVEA